MVRLAALAAASFGGLLGATAGASTPMSTPASTPLLDCLEPIARTFHVRIVDTTGLATSVTCAPIQAHETLQQVMDRMLKPSGLDWRRLDDGTLEVVAAPAPSRLKLSALEIEGDPLPEVQRPDNPLATPLVERATASTTLDRHWLDTAPLLGFNQISWYAPNVYGSGQSLAIRGTERDTDYFPALTVTFDGIDLGTRLLDDELVPLDDVTSLSLARGPRTFESGEGSQAGAISLKTAAPAVEPTTSAALGIGNLGARDGSIAWSGPLGTTGVGATIALDEHELPSFMRQVAVPQATVEQRHNDFGRIKLSYMPDAPTGISAELNALALSGDSSDRQVVAPAPVLGQPTPPFDPLDRNSYATAPLVAQTHARGAAGFVRYDSADQWAIDAHASITTISRDVTELPSDAQWSDQELRRRSGLTLSDHPARDWTILAALEHDQTATSFFTPISTGQVVFNHFATSTDSASTWIEHSWNGVWNTGLGVRWLYEQTTEFGSQDRWYKYHVPIPLAVVEWRPWTDQAFSLSYGTGYRNGGQVNPVVTYSPERSQNLELSWRAQWLGDTLHTALSAFNGKIRDRFTNYIFGTASDLTAGRVRERGLEFELTADLSDYWRLRAGIGVLNSHYSSFIYQYGDPTSEAPPQTATFGVRYGIARGWYGAVDAYHAAAALYYYPAAGRLPPYDVLSFRVGYRTRHWETALTVANAFDAKYAERIQLSAANQSGYRLGDPTRIELRAKRTW
jgi:hypothetical protein